MDPEDLTIYMKIIIISIATHYRPFKHFFSGLLRTNEKKKVVCVCDSHPPPILKPSELLKSVCLPTVSETSPSDELTPLAGREAKLLTGTAQRLETTILGTF